jgi:hypothetical protein
VARSETGHSERRWRGRRPATASVERSAVGNTQHATRNMPMSQIPPNPRRYCPYLGLRADRTSIFTEPTEEHRCHVAEEGSLEKLPHGSLEKLPHVRQPIDLEHQAAFCLTANYPTCPRFVPLPEPERKEPEGPEGTEGAKGTEGTSGPSGSSGPSDPFGSSGPSALRLPPWLMALLGETSVLELGVWIGMAVFVLAVVYLVLVRPLTQAAAPRPSPLPGGEGVVVALS